MTTQRNIFMVLAEDSTKYTHKALSDKLKEAKVPLTASVIGRTIQKMRKTV